MSKRSIEKLADKIIRLSPEESQQLGLIIKAKLLPEMAKKQAGLLEQAANNPQMAQMVKDLEAICLCPILEMLL